MKERKKVRKEGDDNCRETEKVQKKRGRQTKRKSKRRRIQKRKNIMVSNRKKHRILLLHCRWF